MGVPVNAVIPCPECGSKDSREVGTPGVLTCEDCGEYFEDERPVARQVRNKVRRPYTGDDE